LPIKVVWDNDERTVIRMEFDGHWTWDEVQEAVNISNQMTNSVNHIVDGLIDMSRSGGVPSGAMAHARHLIMQRHERSGITVVAGASPAISTLWQVFAQAYQWLTRSERFVFARTVEDARRRIAAKTTPTM
jgi:hypothetical protein